MPEVVDHAPAAAHPKAPKFSLTAQRASPAESGTAQTQTHLFINEYLNSRCGLNNTVATSQDRSAIYSHVQRFRLQQNVKTRFVSTCTFITKSTRGPIPHRYAQQRRPRSENLGSSASFDTEGHKITGKRRAEISDTNSSHIAVETVGVDSDSPRIGSNDFLPGNVCDPFNCTAMQINQSNHNLVQFFLNTGWRAHLKIFGHTDTDLWSLSFKDLPEVIRGCLCNEMHFNALLTLNAIIILQHSTRRTAQRPL